MYSVSNYLTQAGTLPVSTFPEPLLKGHEMAEKALANSAALYSKSEAIKRVVDLYLAKLNEFMADQSPKSLPVPVKPVPKKTSVVKTKAPKPVKEKPVKAKKAQKESIPKPPKPVKTGKVVEKMPFQEEHPGLAVEVAFIKKYVRLHGKRVEPKQILSFIGSIERAVLERRIRKTSPLAAKIEHIRQELRKLHKANAKPFTFLLDNRDSELPAIANTHVYENTVPIIKGFLRLYRDQDVNHAGNLLKRINRAIKTEEISEKNLYYSEVVKIKKNLERFLEDADSLELTQAQLNGLAGLAGLAGFGALNGPSGKTIPTKVNSTELAKMNFELLPLRGSWADCLGTVTLPFSMMVFGGPGSGKSSFCILFAHFLAAELNKKILYVAAEEAIGATLKEKFTRLDAFHENIVITTNIDECCSGYDFVFIDSVNELQLSPEKVSELIQKAKAKNISLILIYRGTKGGSFRGEETNENLVDISLKVEGGVVTPRKNRFGGKGSMRVY